MLFFYKINFNFPGKPSPNFACGSELVSVVRFFHILAEILVLVRTGSRQVKIIFYRRR